MANYKSSYTGQEIDAGIAKANTAIQDVSNKQDTLVSGTNIKTINGNSILGEGNLVIEGGEGGLSSVAHDNTLTGDGTNANPLGVDSSKFQSPLVSGTNIKTINNTSILGSGNITIEGGSGSSDIEVDEDVFPFEISDENDNSILRIDGTGNLKTANFDSQKIANIPKISIAGRVLTSTDTENAYVWTKTDSTKSLKTPWIIEQHQGWRSSTVAPNTIPAFKRAWLNGAEMIEMDARLTADNVYICSHDDSVTVSGTTYVIAETNSDVITNLVLSHDSEYGDCKIPLTETVLKFCANAGMMCNLDCKSINPQTIAELVNKCGMSGKVMYANTTPQNAQTILNYDKHAMFLFNYTSISNWESAFENNKEVLERSWCWQYNNSVTSSQIAEARSKGIKVLVAGIRQYDAQVFDLQPDAFEFDETVDVNAICEQYLESLNY